MPSAICTLADCQSLQPIEPWMPLLKGVAPFPTCCNEGHPERVCARLVSGQRAVYLGTGGGKSTGGWRRVVGLKCPIDQTIFEVYAHLELKTPFNSFENH